MTTPYDDARGVRLCELLRNIEENPARAAALVGRAMELAQELSAGPLQLSRSFPPGLSMPATGIYEVTGLPATPIAPGNTSTDIQINLRVPGVVVGIMAGTVENTDASRGGLAYQINMEGEKYLSFATGSEAGYTSLLCHQRDASWLPCLLPVRGAGGWSVKFRNAASGAPATPVLNFAFLAGQNILQRCFPGVPDGGAVRV